MNVADYPHGEVQKVLWTIGIEAEVIVTTNRGSLLRLWTTSSRGRTYLTSKELQGKRGRLVIIVEPMGRLDARSSPSMEFVYEDPDWLSKEKGVQLADVPAVVIGEGTAAETNMIVEGWFGPDTTAFALETAEGRMLIGLESNTKFLQKYSPGSKIICRSSRLQLIHVLGHNDDQARPPR